MILSKRFTSLDELRSRLKREPGVLDVWLAGSALGSHPPNDIDVVVNVGGVENVEERLMEKYQDSLVLYRGVYLPVDLHIHSTTEKGESWLSETYGEHGWRST